MQLHPLAVGGDLSLGSGRHSHRYGEAGVPSSAAGDRRSTLTAVVPVALRLTHLHGVLGRGGGPEGVGATHAARRHRAHAAQDAPGGVVHPLDGYAERRVAATPAGPAGDAAGGGKMSGAVLPIMLLMIKEISHSDDRITHIYTYFSNCTIYLFTPTHTHTRSRPHIHPPGPGAAGEALPLLQGGGGGAGIRGHVQEVCQ